MIRVNCPACGREFEFADYLRGLTMVCKNCGHGILVSDSRPKIPSTRKAIQAAAETTLPTPPTLAVGDAIQAGVTLPLSVPATPKELPEVRSPVNRPFDSPSMPDWAIERAKAMLRTGVDVPQSVQRLIAQGLSLEAATAVVDRVLEDWTRQQVKPLEQAELRNRWHRILSCVVGCACLFLAYWFFGTWSACRTSIVILLPLACIWFPDEMGVYTSKYSFTGTSLGVFIRWGGWLVLLLISVYLLVLILNTASP